MMLTATAREFRSDAAIASSHTEDLQPNETINKRQRAAPPTVLSASVKPPTPYNRWRHSSRGGHAGSRGNGIKQGGDSSRGSGGWTQHAMRGNKPWRGKYVSGRGRGANNLAWSRPSFRPENRQTSRTPALPVVMKPPKKPKESLLSRSEFPPLPMPPVASPPMTKRLAIKLESHSQPAVTPSQPLTATSHLFRPNPIYQPISDSPASLNTYQETAQPPPSPEQLLRFKPNQTFMDETISSPCIFKRSTSPTFKRRKLAHSPEPSINVKVEEVEPVASSQIFQSHSYAIPDTIKIEKRSSSPPPRHLVKESCSFYPLPEDCRKSNPEYMKNRQAFFSREYNVLKYLGLKRKKVIFRDDGMVIEWTSNTPVWSDTLRPEPPNISSVIEEALQSNSSNHSGKRKSTTPRRSTSRSVQSRTIVAADSSSSRQATFSVESTSPPRSGPPEQKSVFSPSSIPLPRRRKLPIYKPRLPKAGDENLNTTTSPLTVREDTHIGMLPELEHDRISAIDRENDSLTSTSTSSNIATETKTNGVASNVRWPIEELGRVEPLVVDYLQRYIRAFDTGRTALQNAYSEDALFSYRMTLVTPSSSTSQSSSFISYRLPQVTSAVSSILPLYRFRLREEAGEVHYDVVSLGGQAGGGILLTVHGALARADPNVELAKRSEYDHVMAVDQSFVLHRNMSVDGVDEHGGGDQDTSGMEGKETLAPWPLVAVSHQMIVRDIDVRSGRTKFPLPIVSVSLEQFPWLVC